MSEYQTISHISWANIWANSHILWGNIEAGTHISWGNEKNTQENRRIRSLFLLRVFSFGIHMEWIRSWMGCQSIQDIQLIGWFLFQFCMKTGKKGLGTLHGPGWLSSDTVSHAFGDFEFGPAYFDGGIIGNSFGYRAYPFLWRLFGGRYKELRLFTQSSTHSSIFFAKEIAGIRIVITVFFSVYSAEYSLLAKPTKLQQK